MKKLTALAIALTMLLSFAACNSEGGGTAKADVSTTAKAETVKDETTTAKPEETTVPEETTTEETTTTEPEIEYVEPAAEDFEYKYDAALKGAVITKYTGSAEAIRIPTELDGDPVVQFSLEYNKTVTHVEIPDSITYIGSEAFYNCANLESVIIPDSVTTIGYEAFCGCGNLKSIEIPNSVTEIGMGAFWQCYSLESVEIPNSVTTIGQGAFSDCKNLTNILIPDSVTELGCGSVNGLSFGLFKNCENLKSVTIPKGVTTIVEKSFEGCTSLKDITLPDSIIMDGGAFAYCTGLRSLTLPDNASGYSSRYRGANDFFSGCDGLTVTYKGNEYNYTNFWDLYNAMPRKEYTW